MRYWSMPRKRKISEKQTVSPDGAATGNGSAELSATKKKRAPRRKPATKQPVVAENVDAAPARISDEAIRVRAYLIAEERVRRGLPGDENSDWLEARRQLIEELG
jgi:hypothetical protein